VVETNIATGYADTWVGIGHTWDGKIVVSGYAGGDFAAARYNAGMVIEHGIRIAQNSSNYFSDCGEPPASRTRRSSPNSPIGLPACGARAAGV